VVGAHGIMEPTKARLNHILDDDIDEPNNSRTAGNMRSLLICRSVMFADIAGRLED
jgi:hypothetical protein